MGIFLLHLLTFASSLFVIAPILFMVSGILTVVAAIFGLALFRRKNEVSGCFIGYAVVLFLALAMSMATTVAAFILRDSIAHRFYKTNIKSELASYATRPAIRARWDALQTEYSCCGGFNQGTGYTDWEGLEVVPLPYYAEELSQQDVFSRITSVGRNAPNPSQDQEDEFTPTLSQVPDSCCLRRYRGCGSEAFDEVPTSAGIRAAAIRLDAIDDISLESKVNYQIHFQWKDSRQRVHGCH